MVIGTTLRLMAQSSFGCGKFSLACAFTWNSYSSDSTSKAILVAGPLDITSGKCLLN